jgi:malate dehydrogenase (oxaloacetate-decarboxylating)
MTQEAHPMHPTPNASCSFTFKIRLPNRPGMFAKLATVIGNAGGSLEDVTIVSETHKELVRSVTVAAGDVAHEHAIVNAVRGLADMAVLDVADCTFALHKGGKIELVGKRPLRSPHELAMAYTPGVARICLAVAEDKLRAHHLTIKHNTVAIVTDGTAVLGLGDIGPEAALPVMEGKALLFKDFGGVNAFPLCLATKDPDEIVATVKAIAPGFGGINLEDISAPRCFAIEERLQGELDIPVFHDDQHGTAIVALAALTNALKLAGKTMSHLKIVVCGVGAAGVACSKMLLAAGATNLIGCDRSGAIYRGRTENMNAVKAWFAEHTNPEGLRGSVADVIGGADVFLGVSAPGMVTVADIKRMAPKPLVFALANPVPEIMPEEAEPHVAVIATGRSDYPNQINNVLAFPGVFRGALDCRARAITENMKMAAARAIAGLVSDDDLHADKIVPSTFDPRVAPAVAEAVKAAALVDGVARLIGGDVPAFDNLRW